VHSTGYGETIQFVVKSEIRSQDISEARLYFHVYPDNITMEKGRENEQMSLLLGVLRTEAKDGVSDQLVELMNVPLLMGWHDRVIPEPLLHSEVLRKGNTTEDLKLVFYLNCTNCNYKVFPQTVTKYNVPFLTLNKRERVKRGAQCTGCCLHGLIVDFSFLPKYNWVITPRRYVANYCAGSCSNPDPAMRMHMPSDSIARNKMIDSMGRSNGASCCTSDVPKQDPITTLYRDIHGSLQASRTSIYSIQECICT